jgi:hypothetical protein
MYKMRKIFLTTLILTCLFACGESTKKTPPPRDGAVYEGDSLNFVKYTYKEGALASEETFVNGRINGLAKYYYPNGVLRTTIEYKDAKRNGTVVSYYETGEKYGDLSYVNGKIDGVRHNYRKSGALTMSCVYENGKPLPPLDEYDEVGEKIKQPTIKFSIEGGKLRIELSDKTYIATSFCKIGKNELTEIPTAKGIGRLSGAAKGISIRAYYKSPRGAEGAVDAKY